MEITSSVGTFSVVFAAEVKRESSRLMALWGGPSLDRWTPASLTVSSDGGGAFACRGVAVLIDGAWSAAENVGFLTAGGPTASQRAEILTAVTLALQGSENSREANLAIAGARRLLAVKLRNLNADDDEERARRDARIAALE